jgi:hypothetical protein
MIRHRRLARLMHHPENKKGISFLIECIPLSIYVALFLVS